MDNFGDTKVRGSGVFINCSSAGRNKTCDSHVYFCCQHADIHGSLCCQKDYKEKIQPDTDNGNLWLYISLGVFLGFVLLGLFIFFTVFTCGKDRRIKLRKVAWRKKNKTDPTGQMGRVDSSTRMQITTDEVTQQSAYQSCDQTVPPGCVPATSLYPNSNNQSHAEPPKIISPAPLRFYYSEGI